MSLSPNSSSFELLNSHPLPTWIIDVQDFEIKFSNTSAISYYGYSKEEFQESSFLHLFTEDSRIDFFHKTALQKDHLKFNGVYKHCKKNAAVAFIELYFSPFPVGNNNYYQVSVVDVTDRISALEKFKTDKDPDSTNFEQGFDGIFDQEFKLAFPLEETLDLFLEQTGKNKYIADYNKIGYLSISENITASRKIEKHLLKSEQFYRSLIADSLDGMIVVNVDGIISFSSPSVKNVLGFDVNEIEGRNAFEFVHPDDHAIALSSFQNEVIEHPEIKFISIRLLKKNGEWLWCMVRGHNLLQKQFIKGVAVYFHDDSLRKKSNDALKESELRFRNLIRDLQIGIILLDYEGKTILCNKTFTKIFLVEEEELIGKTFKSIAIDPIHEDGRKFESDERPTHKALQTRKPVKDLVMGIYRPMQKERIWILVNADPILDDQGEIMHIICSMKDITARKRMEEEQLFKHVNHQKLLTQATIDGQENERMEIGKELHDNIGQKLTTIKLFLDMAKSTADDATVEMVNLALKNISDVINEIRSMSRALVPSTLKDLGLTESINELVDSMLRTQLMEIQFDNAGFDEDQMPENQKLTLFRIVQEQLNNIIKHADAKQVWIELNNKDEIVVLQIKDDGNGFDLKKVRKGVGFVNIRNRAELFGGEAEICSEPGKGCLLKVSFPQIIARPIIC